MSNIEIHKICIGSVVGCNHAIDNFKRGFRYEIITMGVIERKQCWVFKEISSEQKEFFVDKDYADLLINNGNIKNL
jgi:hypothetical protein